MKGKGWSTLFLAMLIMIPPFLSQEARSDPDPGICVVSGGAWFYAEKGDLTYDVAIHDIDFFEDQDSEFTIVLNGSFPEHRIFSYDPNRSYDWSIVPTVDPSAGIVLFRPLNADALMPQPLRMSFKIEAPDKKANLSVLIFVKNVNDPPTLFYPIFERPFYLQGENVSLILEADDMEGPDDLTFDVNMLKEIGGKPSVNDQLDTEFVLKRGIVWDLNTTTGHFWFDIGDQGIWSNRDGLREVKEVDIVFQVKDGDGGSSIQNHTLILKDLNEPPEAPKGIFVRTGKDLTVEFWSGPVRDPDVDLVRCLWTFSDGGCAISLPGDHLNHTFPREGTVTIAVYADDGRGGESETMQRLVELRRPIPPYFHCDAGEDQIVERGGTLRLVGSGSSDSGIVEFTWIIMKGGHEARLNGSTVEYRFDEYGDYEVFLTLKNGRGETLSDSLVVEVTDTGQELSAFLAGKWPFIIINILLIVTLFVILYFTFYLPRSKEK